MSKVWVDNGSSKSSGFPGSKAVTKGVKKGKGRSMRSWGLQATDMITFETTGLGIH